MPSFKYNVSLCAMYKNEAKYLLEWIEYHLMIGVQHFYLYNNLSNDHHKSLIEPYINNGIISYHEYNVDITNVGHMNAFKNVDYPYNHCVRTYKAESKFIGFIDIDEFIVIRSSHKIDEFLQNYEQYSGLAINWMNFGSSNHYLEPHGLVTESYFLRPPINHPYNQLVKSIINPREFLEWPNVHLPKMTGVIVKEDKTICTHFNDTLIHHKKISLFHYRAKSKEYHLFTKIKRHISLDRLKTPIINAHRKGGDGFFEYYYSNLLLWEVTNILTCNCIEDLTIFKSIPELKKRLKISTPTSSEPSILDNLMIDHIDYLKKFPEILTYINQNRKAFDYFDNFNNSLMPILFHYWFIFHEKNPQMVSLKPAREILKNINLHHYKTPQFAHFIKSEITKAMESLDIKTMKEKIILTDNIIYKYYLDSILSLPLDFDLKYYISQNPNFSQLPTFDVIKQFYLHGIHRASFYHPPYGKDKIRLLLMDCLFPFIYGQWRTVEINYLLTHPQFEVDILINPYFFHANEIVKENMVIAFQRYYQLFPYLNDYNILIFNPEFNVLNQFNKHIDGTTFNKALNAQFLLTKHKDFDFRRYDLGYSIFLAVRNANSYLIKQQWWPSICKIYPGGGYLYNENLINKDLIEMNQYNETAIVTQDFIAKTVEKYLPNIVKIYGVPILSPGKDMTPYVEKSFSNKLDICFSSLGFNPKKGFHNYIAIVQRFVDHYPSLNIKFHVVGIDSSNPMAKPFSNLTYHGTKTPNDLFAFYSNIIDIIISPINYLENGDPDGFPLGSEAMIQGCIPILCDLHGCNQHFGFTNDESLIIKTFDLETITSFILSLYNDPLKKKNMSHAIAMKSRALLGPEKQLYPVVKTLMTTVAKSRIKEALKEIPQDYIGGCPLDKAFKLAEIVIENDFKTCVDIGTWRGRSFIPMLIATQLIGGKSYGIDPYTPECLYEYDLPQDICDHLRKIVPTLDLEGIYNHLNKTLLQQHSNYSLIKKTAKDAIHEIPEKIDLVHIDGNHDRHAVMTDLEYYVPRVKTDGYIIMDDINFDTVKSTLPYLEQFATKISDFGLWGIWKKKNIFL